MDLPGGVRDLCTHLGRVRAFPARLSLVFSLLRPAKICPFRVPSFPFQAARDLMDILLRGWDRRIGDLVPGDGREPCAHHADRRGVLAQCDLENLRGGFDSYCETNPPQQFTTGIKPNKNGKPTIKMGDCDVHQ